MTSKKEIIFIIVHHGGVEVTERCVESILLGCSTDVGVNVVIVDNSESAEDREYLSKYVVNICGDNHVGLISVENLGYFRSANKALEQGPARTSTYDFVAICNNDLVFDKDFITLIAKAKYSHDTFAIYPDLTSTGGKHENPRVETSISVFRLIAYKCYYSSYLLASIMSMIVAIAKKSHNRIFSRSEVAVIKQATVRELVLGVGACVVLTKKYFGKYSEIPSGVFGFSVRP